MAEAKKDDKKKGGGDFGFEEVFLLVLGLITIFFVTIPQFTGQSNTQESSSSGVPVRNTIVTLYDKVFNEQQIDATTKEPSLLDQTKFRVTDIIKNIFYGVIILSIFCIILFFILKNYFEFKLKVVSDAYNKKIGAGNIQTAEDAPDTRVVPKGYVADTNGLVNPAWEKIQAYAQSGNQAELSLAIIEADVMLFDVLKKSGFVGETIGEVLKNANTSQLATLDFAWRAHKVRNELAHQGSKAVLSRTEVESALDAYKKVFDELGLV